MNCLDYFGVTAMAGVEDAKFLRDGAGNPEPKAGMDSDPENVALLISGHFGQFYACTVQITAKHLMNLVVQLRFVCVLGVWL